MSTVWVVTGSYANSFNSSFDDEVEVKGVLATEDEARAFAVELQTVMTCFYCHHVMSTEDFHVVCDKGPVGWHAGQQFPARHFGELARDTTVTEWEVGATIKRAGTAPGFASC